MPEGDVAFLFGDLAGVDKGFGEGVKLVVVVDDVHLIVHALPSIPISKFCQLLSGALAFGRWVDILIAQVVVEVIPIAVDVPWQGLPDVVLCSGTSHWSVCHGGCKWQVEWWT